jgi:hypothetical protein
MRPHAVRAKLNRTFGLLLLAVSLSSFASAQFTMDQLDGVRQRLGALRICLAGDDDVDRLSVGLLSGYGNNSGGASGGYSRGYSHQSPLPPPPDYMATLDQDVKACLFASKIKDHDARKELLAQVREDIRIKAQDCQKFGMGRVVTVHVTTLKGPVADNGWEVFYKWQCASAFQPAEMRAPTLTSPATLKLPPGNYAIRAQKHLPDAQTINTSTVTVVIGLQPGADIELPIQ